MKDKRGQFYLVATIIIVALVVSITVVFNYSTRTDYYNVEKIAKEVAIEGENVLDYDSLHSSSQQFDDFSKVYSAYAEDKDIYFIIVDQGQGIQEAYKYSNSVKVDLTGNLNVNGGNIRFILDSKDYNFKLEQGKNFYYVVIYDKGGERYVYTG